MDLLRLIVAKLNRKNILAIMSYINVRSGTGVRENGGEKVHTVFNTA